MKKIPMAYQYETGKIQTREMYWPQICPCCGELTHANFYNLYCRVDLARIVPGQAIYNSSDRYYSLQWRVPYCYDCSKHAENSEIMKSAIILSGFFFFILSVLVLTQIGHFIWFPLPIFFLLFLDIFLFKIVLPFLLKPQMKTSCCTHDFAVHANCRKDNVVLSFDDDNYARAFARLNSLPLD
jgi:hypothetical protein